MRSEIVKKILDETPQAVTDKVREYANNLVTKRPMENIKIKPRLTFTVPIELSEGEAMALDALAGYGFKEFTDCFYKHMGTAYLKPYEADLKNLFEKIESIRPAIAEIKESRKKLETINH